MGWDYNWALSAAHFGISNPTLFDICQKLGSFYSFKTIPLIALLVGIWFARSLDAKPAVLSGIGGTFIALVIARGIQNLGPHRPRPAHVEALPFLNSDSIPPDWSSFPSDTAAVLGALSIAIFLASRPLGALAIVHAIVALLVSKFIVGAHYIGDLIAGLAIGGLSTLACYAVFKRYKSAPTKIDNLVETYPGVAAGIAFICLFQIATFFDDVRNFSQSGLKLVGIVQMAPEDEEPTAN